MLRPWFLALSLAIPAAAQNAPTPPPPQAASQPEAQKGSVANLGTDVDAVRQRIESALASDPALRGSSFSVNITDDTVEITGVANSGRERTAARRIVQSFSGNLRVKDRITVAGVTPPSADAPDQSRARTATTPSANAPDAGTPDPNAPTPGTPTPEQPLAKPESDEDSPAKKANKPKRDPKKHGDKATEDPRDPR